jgi:hypothetical protein
MGKARSVFDRAQKLEDTTSVGASSTRRFGQSVATLIKR